MIQDIHPTFLVSIPFGNFDFILRNKSERQIRSSAVAPEPCPANAIHNGSNHLEFHHDILDITPPSATIDTSSHMLNLTPHTFQSLVQVSDWNQFMYSPGGIRRFVVCFYLSLMAVVISAAFVTPDTISWQIVFFISWLICLTCTLLAACHWVDIQLFKLTIRQFDCIYVLTYALIYQFAEVYRWTLSVSPYYTFSMVIIITSLIGYVIGVTVILATDSVPKQFASHRFQLLVYFAGMIYHAYIWIIRAYTKIEQLDEEMQVCLYACISVVQLSASASFTLAVFFAKFSLSLIIWPTNAVMLRTKIVLQRSDTQPHGQIQSLLCLY
jgi:hypothetical protein